ncbi:MAG TPA: hypothetical protein VJ925_14345, partial [Longimicrobiales bacterium]|nr:hypothetical protein [Longimicrobiales bacterium]
TAIRIPGAAVVFIVLLISSSPRWIGQLFTRANAPPSTEGSREAVETGTMWPAHGLDSWGDGWRLPMA